MKKKIINVIVILLISACMLMVGAKAATTIMASSVTYDGTTVEAALDELMTKIYHCPEDSEKDYYLCTYDIKVGDYITNYASPHTSFTIPAALTGHDTDQTINPNELRLWRVISINNDGTLDMVSEYTSSTGVNFKGLVGYKNYVGTLNLIASQYINTNYYAVRARHMGYDGQTSIITDTSKFTTTAPWNVSTSDNFGEGIGRGDIMYEKDFELVKNAIGTLRAYENGTTTYATYYLASRYYMYSSTTNYHWFGRTIYQDGLGSVYYSRLYYNDSGVLKDDSAGTRKIRPIVTIKADAYVTGCAKSGTCDGTKDKPWQLD